MADNSKYTFNDREYGKGRLVLAVIRQFIKDFNPSYQELKQEFPDSLQGSLFVVISADELEARNQNSNDPRTRYFDEPDSRFTTSDGIETVVSNQWGLDNIDDFIKKAKELGYDIQEAGNSMKSIKELFEEYKKNPRTDWIPDYEIRCNQVKNLKGKPLDEYTTSILKDIWLTPANGIASVRPGFLSNVEFDSLLGELPEITSRIIEDPSPETLTSIEKWAKSAKKKGQFKTIKWGVINRVFAAANPYAYSSLLSEGTVLKLINILNTRYKLNIDSQGNWCQLNIALMTSLKSQGLEDEDIFHVNTFVWELYVNLTGDTPLTDDSDETPNATVQVSRPTCENIIYYGPPGTGKTYKLQQLLKDNYTEEYALPDESAWLSNHIDTLSWHEVIILVLMESSEPLKVTDIVNHEYYQLKAQLNDREKNLRATAWAALQSHAVSDSKTVNLSRRIEPLVFDKTEDSRWFLVKDQYPLYDEMQILYEQLKAGPEIEEAIKRYEFVTFHQSFSYEEFMEGLRPITNSEGDISYEIKKGVFRRICELAERDSDNQYALVIDEINRGNISKIFGELITLIEVDKRSGCDNELTLTLPYSGATFSVPSNLDIIGTMNTADRSLTHIDVALRRRFDFKELRTDYSLISKNVDGINLRWMLYAINQRIELLLDREHILGHALLMHAESLHEIGQAFKTSIMPLLEEYFFENWDKINRVLNDNGFIEEQKDAYNTWLGNADDYAAKSYRINFEAMHTVEAYQQIYSGVDSSAFAELE